MATAEYSRRETWKNDALPVTSIRLALHDYEYKTAIAVLILRPDSPVEPDSGPRKRCAMATEP